MSRCRDHDRQVGFTLVEVLVAMVVVALGIGALLATLSSAADTVGRLRQRSLAQWIALNRISEVRLDNSRPGTGSTSGDVEYAGSKWVWQQEITEQDVEGILRIDVAVAPAGTTAGRTVTASGAASKEGAADFPALAKASGFIGTSSARPSGLDPDWGLPQSRNPGGGGSLTGDGTTNGGGGLPGGAASRTEP